MAIGLNSFGQGDHRGMSVAPAPLPCIMLKGQSAQADMILLSMELLARIQVRPRLNAGLALTSFERHVRATMPML